VPREGLSPRAQQERVFNNHVDATRQLADAVHAGRTPRPDMVIWPENGSDLDPYLDRATGARITAMVDDLGVPTLIGAVLDAGPHHVRNSGILWTPGQGPGARYTKRHPVPFGEYIPFRGLFTRFVGQLALVPRDFIAGREVGVLDIAGTRVGAVICFEVAYDDLVRDAVRAGGGLLVVQTNNATYGRTGQPDQQLAISRLRTIEHGRAMVIAATSGISAVIAPDGTVTQRTREFTREVLVAAVPVRRAHTLATDVGAWPELALCLLGVGAIVMCRPRRTSGVVVPATANVIEPATVLATPGEPEGR
jgi:apolipoprotein N-acyltransferase